MKNPEIGVSHILITLLKRVVDRQNDAELWHLLLECQSEVKERMAMLGLDVVLDDAEGCAYLRQRTPEEGEPDLPRLVARRQLSYSISLLLALLRKKLVEVDAKSADTRLIVGRDEIVEMLKVFLPDASNEARFIDRVDTHINKVVDLGFLRRLSGQTHHYEVQRILKAYVDGQWLGDLEERLGVYCAYAGGAQIQTEDSES